MRRVKKSFPFLYDSKSHIISFSDFFVLYLNVFFRFFAGPMNFINNDPDHIEVLDSKTVSNSTTEVYAFDGNY